MLVFPAVPAVPVPLVVHVHGMDQEEVRPEGPAEIVPVSVEMGVGVIVHTVKNTVVNQPCLIAQLIPAGYGIEGPPAVVQFRNPLVGRGGGGFLVPAGQGKQAFAFAGPGVVVGADAVDTGRQPGHQGFVHGPGLSGKFPPDPVHRALADLCQMPQIPAPRPRGLIPQGIYHHKNYF